MGNVNKCQDVKRSADYRAADGQDAKQFVGVIDAAVKANFDFQGHPSDFRAADTNSDHFISKTELADILTKMGAIADLKTSMAAEIQSAIQTAVDTILTSTDSIKTAVDSVNSSIVTSEVVPVNTATTIGAAKDMITSILGAEIKNAIYESNVTCSVYSSETGKHLGEIKNNDDNGKHVGQIKNGTIDAEDVNHVQGGPNQGENAGIEDELDVLAADLATDAAFYAEEAMLDA
eukprot:tig00020553_g10694.t1